MIRQKWTEVQSHDSEDHIAFEGRVVQDKTGQIATDEGTRTYSKHHAATHERAVLDRQPYTKTNNTNGKAVFGAKPVLSRMETACKGDKTTWEHRSNSK